MKTNTTHGQPVTNASTTERQLGQTFQRYPRGYAETDATGHTPYKAPVPDEIKATEEIQIERKIFIISRRENQRGEILRIVEETGGRHNTIIIPATGIQDFIRLLQRVAGPPA